MQDDDHMTKLNSRFLGNFVGNADSPYTNLLSDNSPLEIGLTQRRKSWGLSQCLLRMCRSCAALKIEQKRARTQRSVPLLTEI